MNKELTEKIKEFEGYFKDDIAAIEEELTKSQGYSAIIDKEIEKLTDTARNIWSNQGESTLSY